MIPKATFIDKKQANIQEKNIATNPEPNYNNYHQSNIPSKGIKNRHIDGIIIETGLAADRPSGETWTKAWFATDTFALSIWTGSVWKSVTLT